MRGNSSKRGYSGEHRSFRRAVLQRDGWVCQLCGGTAEVADHWPLSRRELVDQGYDPNDPRRGRALCISCHNAHTGRTEGKHNLRG